jgi:DNA-binding PadR family transcriptional regulator
MRGYGTDPCGRRSGGAWAMAADMVGLIGEEKVRQMTKQGPGWVGGGWHGGHGGRPGRPGPPPWVQDLVRSFGGPDLGGAPRGPKVRRGDVRSAILDVLSREPMNGYQVIQQISERSGGAWKPSPGSVYPTIQQLEDEGLVEGREVEGRRELHLTDAGRTYVEENADLMAATWRPFEDPEPARGPAGGISNLKPVISQTMSALWQVMTQGTDQQRAEAVEILNETRRRLYGLLAEGDPE